MKLFLDTASRELIQQWLPTGLIDGVTTNPSHMSKEGSDTKKILLDICAMVPGDVSIEVVEKSPDDVYRQAKEIYQLAKNVVVKIPCAPDYLPVMNKLVKEGVALNITLVFTTLQALLVAKLGVKYISPFIGRLDDIGLVGMDLIEDLVELKREHEFKSQILAASIRTVNHWQEAALLGADVATVPPKLIEQAMEHPLTDSGIKKFDQDWQSLGKKSLLG